MVVKTSFKVKLPEGEFLIHLFILVRHWPNRLSSSTSVSSFISILSISQVYGEDKISSYTYNIKLHKVCSQLSISSVQLSHSFMSNFLLPHRLQHMSPPCPTPASRVYSNSYPSSQWCHSTISSSVFPSPPTFNLSQHKCLFKWVSSLHQVAKVLEFQL